MKTLQINNLKKLETAHYIVKSNKMCLFFIKLKFNEIF